MKTARLLPALIPSLMLGLMPLSACSSPTPTTTGTLPASAEARLAKLETDIAGISARLSASASPSSSLASGATSSDPNAVKELRVQPDPVRISPGQTAQLELVLMVMNNDTTTVAKNFNLFGISSSDTSTATVSADGQITGIKTGAAVVTVRLGNVSKTVAVIVEGASATPTPTPTASATATPTPTPTPSPSPTGTDEVESLTLSLLSSSVVVNGTTEIQTAYVKLKNGTEGLLNNRTVLTWASSNTSVATINESGVITGKAAGTTTISGTYKGFTSTVNLTVTAN